MQAQALIEELEQRVKRKGYTLRYMQKNYSNYSVHGTVWQKKLSNGHISGSIVIRGDKAKYEHVLAILAHEVGHIYDAPRLFKRIKIQPTPKDIINDEAIATAWAVKYVRQYDRRLAVQVLEKLTDDINTYYRHHFKQDRRRGYLLKRIAKNA